METPESTGPITIVKADLAKRLLAYFIDGVIAAVIGGILAIFLSALGGLLSFAYMICRDGMGLEQTGKKSVGKYLMKLKVIRLDGNPVDLETSLRRNWTIAIVSLSSFGFNPGLGIWGLIALVGTVLFFYEVYKVYSDPDGRRWGDEQAGTLVVDDVE